MPPPRPLDGARLPIVTPPVTVMPSIVTVGSLAATGHADRQHRPAAADDGRAGARADELDAHVDRDAAGVRAGARS